jgi:hypothetical protein
LLSGKVHRGHGPLLQEYRVFSWFPGVPKGREIMLRKVLTRSSGERGKKEPFHCFRVAQRDMKSRLEDFQAKILLSSDRCRTGKSPTLRCDWDRQAGKLSFKHIACPPVNNRKPGFSAPESYRSNSLCLSPIRPIILPSDCIAPCRRSCRSSSGNSLD